MLLANPPSLRLVTRAYRGYKRLMVAFSSYLQDEDATRALGAALAGAAEDGDVILLSGDLGAGKTALARGFVQAAVGEPVDVPSPTFTLVQDYDGPGYMIHHFDLYRVEHPDELVEIGFEDALADGVTLVEWPERLGPWRPRDALEIALRIDGAGRTWRIDHAPHSWQDRLTTIAQSLTRLQPDETT